MSGALGPKIKRYKSPVISERWAGQSTEPGRLGGLSLDLLPWSRARPPAVESEVAGPRIAIEERPDLLRECHAKGQPVLQKAGSDIKIANEYRVKARVPD